jgi:hypothetical protein
LRDMSDQIEPTEDLADGSWPAAGENTSSEEPVPTGNSAVDEVLASLGALDDAPVDEHVAVYEKAHEQLRGALDE